MAWLLRAGEVLATLEVADSVFARGRGLLGLASFDGALLLHSTRAVHTLGMRFPIDVAFCDRDLKVVDVTTMSPWRLGLPRLKARCVIEAEAGAFERWCLVPGDHLEVRE
ncbi:MAG: DUF192 domain-containing protein [Actinomycetota bacterium]|jgi:hypothetical protein|nr:DUF192 domain-containing protein [Actinomycetota bacterium]